MIEKRDFLGAESSERSMVADGQVVERDGANVAISRGQGQGQGSDSLRVCGGC